MAACTSAVDAQHQAAPNEQSQRGAGAMGKVQALEPIQEVEQMLGRTEPPPGNRRFRAHQKTGPPKVDYVQRQREYFQREVSRAREARVDVSATAARLVLPDLKTALEAVARRDAAASAAAAAAAAGGSRASRLSSSTMKASSSFLAPPRTPPGSGSGSASGTRTSSSQGRRAAKQPRYPGSPPRTPPRGGLPAAAHHGHRLSGSSGDHGAADAAAPPAAPAAAAEPQHLPPVVPPDPAQHPCTLPSPSTLPSTIPLPPITAAAPDPAPLFGHERFKARSRATATLSLPSAQDLAALVQRPGSSLAPKQRRRSAIEIYPNEEVDTSTLFLMDQSLRPDDENEEELHVRLTQLRDGSAAAEQVEEATYSHLVKPALKPIASPLVFPSSEGWDSQLTLGWSNRGISVKKMGQLRDMLMQNTFLTGLQLAGNSLTNDCVGQILGMLSLPEAPPIRQLDLSSNASLDWRCACTIATALGVPDLGSPTLKASVREAAASFSRPPPLLHMGLRRLVLAEVKLGDRGAAALAAALRSNRALKDLNVSRCSILDHGGAALADSLTNGCLQTLDISWNSLGSASSRALMDALASNGSLLYLGLSHNGLSDLDTARVLRGLMQNGTWLHVDLSHNNLGAGSTFLIAELMDLLGKRCAQLIFDGSYGSTWDTDWQQLSASTSTSRPCSGRLTRRNSSGLAPDTSELSTRIPHHRELGCQLSRGPVMLNLEGNPLGVAGLREVLHSLNWISAMMEDATARAQAKQQQQQAPGAAGPGTTAPPDWPIQIALHTCNIDIGDGAPDEEDMEGEGMDPHSPNPFLPSLYKVAGPLTEAQIQAEAALQAQAQAKAKPGAGKKAGKDSAPPPAPPPPPKYPLTSQSQRLDLQCPGGRYVLDMAHPASALLVRHLLGLGAELEAAAAKLPPGLGPARVLRIKDVLVLGQPSSAKRLENLHDLDAGAVSFSVEAPALLGPPSAHPLCGQLLGWLCSGAVLSYGNERCNELWKLSVMRVACSQFYFSCEEAMQLISQFNLATSQQLSVAEIMYARCNNPLDFWLEGLPLFHPTQVEVLMQRLGEFPALNIQNPSGRYCLNLSRTLDRFIAMRLQEAAVQEAGSSARGKQAAFWVNWRNASLDGLALRMEGLLQLHVYTIPDSGLLRLDFTTYQVPNPESQPCTEPALKLLLTELRGINRRYLAQALQVQLAKHGGPQPGVRTQPSSCAPRTSLKERAVEPAPAATTPKGWPVSRILGTPLRTMAASLRSEAAAHALGQPARPGPPPAHKAPPPPLRASPSTRVAGHGHAPLAPQPVAWWQEVEGGGFKAAGKALLERLKTTTEASRVPTAEAGRKQPAVAHREEEEEESWDLPPPQQRAAGAHMTQQQAAQAQELTAQLLLVLRLQDAAQLLCKFSAEHTARLLHTLVRASPSTGHKVAGLLLEQMPPAFAVRFLYSLHDHPAALLPPETKQALAGGCSPQLLRRLGEVQGEINALATKRAQQVRVALQCFAAAHSVTMSQVQRVVRALPAQPDRCTAVAAWFCRIVDRAHVFELLQALHPEEQRQAMQRLGPWQLWQTLKSCPLDWGDVHFYLDLGDPEQKEVAKDLVHMACKASMALKAQNPAQRAQQLLNLRLDGALVTLEEDASLWSSIEGSCSSMEFDVAPSLDQLELKWAVSAVVIQRAWRKFRRRSQAPPSGPVTEVQPS